MGDHWNGDGYGERMTGPESDDQVRGRATEEDEYDDVTEDQEDEEDVDADADLDDESTF